MSIIVVFLFLKMESLFGSLPEMLDFQRVFLQTLEERTTSSPEYHALETPEKLKVKYGGEIIDLYD